MEYIFEVLVLGFLVWLFFDVRRTKRETERFLASVRNPEIERFLANEKER